MKKKKIVEGEEEEIPVVEEKLKVHRWSAMAQLNRFGDCGGRNLH
jgi:hypothetical protein